MEQGDGISGQPQGESVAPPGQEAGDTLEQGESKEKDAEGSTRTKQGELIAVLTEASGEAVTCSRAADTRSQSEHEH